MADNIIAFPRRAANDNELVPPPVKMQRLTKPAVLSRVIELRRAA
ncbi:hypothetical protein [Synechococcus phage Yong-M3-232]|nr:hypothetical protein [Synechococcus phage Yong-M3-232]